MKTGLIGLACLVVGLLGALGYSHYLGEGKQLAYVQAELDAMKADLDKATQQIHDAKDQTDAMSAQIQQLNATKQDLTQQVDQLKNAAPATPSAPVIPTIPGFSSSSMAGIVKAQMANHNHEQLLLLESRLHLTPDQITAVQAALDAEEKRTEDMTSKMFAGGKVDTQAVVAELKGTKSVDQTLNEILTPDQKTAYQQMKADEKTSSAETSANFEMSQMAPLLQLSDAQKDQVGGALYQVQLNMQDPGWIKANMPSTPGDPMAIIDAQAKAKEDALAKVLTPDQLATYHQQAQNQLALQKAMMQKFMPSAPGATAPAPAAP